MCALSESNGIWNIFGGLLNWDDSLVVGDDPYFQTGYDGWRLDCVHGFWGNYVKEYMEASYTYDEMDHNQDAHRQRILDCINDTNGTAGAFDVSTKGILHSAHWRFLCGKEMQGYAYILT
ncbi:putative alpha-amylase [Helianthus anomalus]